MLLIEDLGKAKYRFGIYECPLCHSYFKAISTEINTGRKVNCGCANNCGTHKESSTRLYKIWASMKQRTRNDYIPSNRNKNYVSLNISIAEEWYTYTVFRDWALQNGYDDTLSIDRIDTYGDYSPSNCRWVDHFIQGQNTVVIRANNKSGLRGVSICSSTKKWKVQIKVETKVIYLGLFTDLYEAGSAYNNYIVTNNLAHTQNPIGLLDSYRSKEPYDNLDL